MPCNCSNGRNGAQNSNCKSCNNSNSNLMNAGTAGVGCGNNSGVRNPGMTGVADLQLATAYVVPQVYTQIYTPEKALKQGTCFPELDMVY